MFTIILLTLTILSALALLQTVSTPTVKGLSTIVWGTHGKLAVPIGAIVESMDITPKNPTGLGEIENGDGAVLADVLLDDGFDAKVSCVEDPSKTWPEIGGQVTLTISKLTGTGSQAYVCYMAGNPDQKYQRKKEGMRTLNLRYRPGIAS